MPEVFHGRAADLYNALRTAREVRKLTIEKLALMNELVESLHSELRKALAEQRES